MLNKKILFVALAIFGMTSCSEWLDVNTDPSVPASVPDKILLSGAQASLSTIVGGQIQLYGGILAQHYTQSNGANQYKATERYDFTSSMFNGEYTRLYSGALYDLKKLEERAVASGNNNLLLISTTLQAYTYQLLADLYEEVPYFESLQGDKGVVKPKFDQAPVIYADLIARLNAALANEISNSTSGNFGANDFFFGGDMSKWVAFANTLKLKLAVRQSKVSMTPLNAIDLDATTFLTYDAKNSGYKNEPGRYNPMYDSEYYGLGNSNIRASRTLLSYLQTNEDTRLGKIYDASVNGGTYLALEQGDFDQPSAAYDPAKLSRVICKSTDPVYLLSKAESYFLQAEAYQLKGQAAKAEAAYKLGVQASFDKFAAGSSTAFVADGGAYKYAGTESIITQKWISMAASQSIEAFIEFNRTGFPTFLTVSKNSKLDNKSNFPRRMLFPEIEKRTNAANVPTQKPIDENLWWSK